jgi:hypothetical protein
MLLCQVNLVQVLTVTFGGVFFHMNQYGWLQIGSNFHKKMYLLGILAPMIQKVLQQIMSSIIVGLHWKSKYVKTIFACNKKLIP